MTELLVFSEANALQKFEEIAQGCECSPERVDSELKGIAKSLRDRNRPLMGKKGCPKGENSWASQEAGVIHVVKVVLGACLLAAGNTRFAVHIRNNTDKELHRRSDATKFLEHREALKQVQQGIKGERTAAYQVLKVDALLEPLAEMLGIETFEIPFNEAAI